MMVNLSSHLAELNITVNSVSPAMVGGYEYASRRIICSRSCGNDSIKEDCKPFEVASMVSMYASTRFVTGQSLIIAGGLKHP